MITSSKTRDLGVMNSAGLQPAISEAVVSACLRVFEGRLRAVVLTGSVARHEATFIHDPGGWEALGDAEFFLVFDKRSALPGGAVTESVRQQAQRTLAAQGIRCKIDLSPVHPAYLRGLQPHILAYELRECGEVVWGDPTILSLIPRFRASAIELEDAWRLLCNRMVEYLAVAADLLDPDQLLPPAAFYRTVKLYLDMATSLLVFVGEYEPTYSARAIRLSSLAAACPPKVDFPFPLDAFATRVAFCTSFKLNGEATATFSGAEARTFWKDAVAYARLLWRWELRRLSDAENTLSDHELIQAWMRCESSYARLRGWASMLRRCGWMRSFKRWPRWVRLAAHGTPRHWIYAVAAELCFGLCETHLGQQPNWKELESWLPMNCREDGRVLDIYSQVAANYHQFLETTCA